MRTFTSEQVKAARWLTNAYAGREKGATKEMIKKTVRVLYAESDLGLHGDKATILEQAQVMVAKVMAEDAREGEREFAVQQRVEWPKRIEKQITKAREVLVRKMNEVLASQYRPLSEISWTNDAIAAAAEIEIWSPVLEWITRDENPATPAQVMEHFQEELQRIARTGTHRSTSAMDNVATEAKMVALANAVEYWTLRLLVKEGA